MLILMICWSLCIWHRYIDLFWVTAGSEVDWVLVVPRRLQPPSLNSLHLFSSLTFLSSKLLLLSLSLLHPFLSLSTSCKMLIELMSASPSTSVPDYKQLLFIISNSEPNGKTNQIDYTRFQFTIPEEERGGLAFNMQPLTHFYPPPLIHCHPCSPSLLSLSILPL